MKKVWRNWGELAREGNRDNSTRRQKGHGFCDGRLHRFFLEMVSVVMAASVEFCGWFGARKEEKGV